MTAARKPPVIALDGPSGSGKGTVGQRLAGHLGWHFLDSGALYRILALAAQQSGVDLNREDELAALAQRMHVGFIARPDQPVQALLDGRDVGDQLRTETAGEGASQVAVWPAVRKALLQKQHALREPPGLVADGRDMGTTVFPDAILKVYLQASPEVRAERRYKQLKEKGFDVNLPRLLREIRERDARDAGRTASPLKPAADAYILDTSPLGISEVVDRIERWLHERLALDDGSVG